MVNGQWSVVNGFPKFKTHASDFSPPIFYPCHGLKPCHGSFRHPPLPRLRRGKTRLRSSAARALAAAARLRRGKKKPASLEAGRFC
jgi:hypothetical protein